MSKAAKKYHFVLILEHSVRKPCTMSCTVQKKKARKATGLALRTGIADPPVNCDNERSQFLSSNLFRFKPVNKPLLFLLICLVASMIMNHNYVDRRSRWGYSIPENEMLWNPAVGTFVTNEGPLSESASDQLNGKIFDEGSATMVANDIDHENAYNKSSVTITDKYQNPLIQQQGCSSTVVMVDPHLGSGVLWALESVVANIHPLNTTCFLLQTSTCMFDNRDHQHRGGIDQSNIESISYSYQQKANLVLSSAQSGFYQMIKMGNVRMTVLNYTKYHLRSCINYYNPSYMWENIQYWGPDEFLPGIDSDLVLIVQGDTVLCHNLSIEKWKDVAWVGAPWKPSKGKAPWLMCSAQPRHWLQFHNASSIAGTAKSYHTVPTASINIPYYPTEHQICSDIQYGPQGNGGLSLRSRSWVQKAIRYCPTSIFQNSGLSRVEFDAAPCHADQIIAEDLYFATVLRGIGAPLPSALEAALFAQELQSVGDILKHYQQEQNRSFIETTVKKRWYSKNDPTGLRLFQWMEKQISNVSNGVDPIVSIGLHKPWNTVLRNRLNENHLNDQCPFMKKIVEARMARSRNDK